MEIVFGVLIAGILGLLISILYTLDQIEKTLKRNDESLSKIASYLEQINEKNCD